MAGGASVRASHCVFEHTCAGCAAHAEDAPARSPLPWLQHILKPFHSRALLASLPFHICLSLQVNGGEGAM